MSIGGRTWPSTETSGDRRYAKDSPDRRPSSGKQLRPDVLGGKTVGGQPLGTRHTSAVCVKGNAIPALACTATASDAQILRLQAQIHDLVRPTNADEPGKQK